MHRARRGIGIVAALLASATTIASAQDVANPNFDSDLSGWTPGASAGFVIEWVNEGSPSAGLAQIASATAPGVNGGAYLRQCFNGIGVGDVWRLSARMKMELRAGDTCRLGVFFFSQPDCAGPSFGAVPTVRSGSQDWSTVVETETAPSGAVSAYILLNHAAVAASLVPDDPLAGTASVCQYDSVRLAVNGVYAQDFELYPPDLSAISPASCSGLCVYEGTPDGLCYCDEFCNLYDDCCLDACTTCGECP